MKRGAEALAALRKVREGKIKPSEAYKVSIEKSDGEEDAAADEENRGAHNDDVDDFIEDDVFGTTMRFAHEAEAPGLSPPQKGLARQKDGDGFMTARRRIFERTIKSSNTPLEPLFKKMRAQSSTKASLQHDLSALDALDQDLDEDDDNSRPQDRAVSRMPPLVESSSGGVQGVKAQDTSTGAAGATTTAGWVPRHATKRPRSPGADSGSELAEAVRSGSGASSPSKQTDQSDGDKGTFCPPAKDDQKGAEKDGKGSQDEAIFDAKNLEPPKILQKTLEVKRVADIATAVKTEASTDVPTLKPLGLSIPFYLLHVAVSPSGKELLLFGKAYVAATDPSGLRAEGTYVNACAVVRNLERHVLVAPRLQPPSPENGSTSDDAILESETWLNMSNAIQSELFETRKKFGIRKSRYKLVKRHNALNMPGIPKRRNLMFLKWALSVEAADRLPVSCHQGESYCATLGLTTPLDEHFMIDRRVMGPSWLTIEATRCLGGGDARAGRLSSCSLEIDVDGTKNIVPACENARATPTMACCSLSCTAIAVTADHKEIIMINCLVDRNVDLDKSSSREREAFSSFRGLRRLPGLPPFHEPWLKRLESLKVVVFESEAALLNAFINFIAEQDPDVMLSHSLFTDDVALLASRCSQLKIAGWNRLSRLDRRICPTYPKVTAPPQIMAQQVFGGRLLCDTLTQTQDMLRNRVTYELCELVKDLFPAEQSSEAESIALAPIYSNEVSEAFKTLDSLCRMCTSGYLEAEWTYRIALQLRILNLTREMSNLAGCPWQVSLLARRAERNDYLLLHQFHDRKYLLPPRKAAPGTSEKRGTVLRRVSATTHDADIDEEGDLGGEVSAPARSKGAAYSGGLVLEPKRGLYDRYILLLDFNSLYPSIIREYKICFTTTEWSDTDAPATLADETVKGGATATKEGGAGDDSEHLILPTVVSNFVHRRREVKEAMKRLSSATQPAEYMALDTRQLALKLTANSIYGCLGFPGSRFYARPIAALVTKKGRELLEGTKQRVESAFSVNVVYGDTDSLMVDSGYPADLESPENYAKALEVARRIKKMINAPSSYLEIELDGVFARLLLLMKKKYACLKVVDFGRRVFEQENKGLDIVRRDWSLLTKQLGNKILSFLFDPSLSLDAVVEKIHEELSHVRQQIDDKKIPSDLYIISKMLTKFPHQYADAKQLPHVQVALRLMQMGRTVKPGSIIPYIICLPPAGASSSPPLASRALHPEELEKNGGAIDLEWYKTTQLLQPLARLCSHISGTSTARIAECLGLSESKYAEREIDLNKPAESDLAGEIEGDDGTTEVDSFDVEMSGAEAAWARESLTCLGCDGKSPLNHVLEFLECQQCKMMYPFGQLANWIARRAHQLYSEASLYKHLCADCSNMSGRLLVMDEGRCVEPGCPGGNNSLKQDPLLSTARAFALYLRSRFDIGASSRHTGHKSTLCARLKAEAERLARMDGSNEIQLGNMFQCMLHL